MGGVGGAGSGVACQPETFKSSVQRLVANDGKKSTCRGGKTPDFSSSAGWLVFAPGRRRRHEMPGSFFQGWKFLNS